MTHMFILPCRNLLHREGTASVLATHISLADIVWVFVDISGEAKVADFYYIVLWQQNVSSCQISVDTLHTKTDIGILFTNSTACLFVLCIATCTHRSPDHFSFTFREDRNSMPLATWKLYLIRSSIVRWSSSVLSVVIWRYFIIIHKYSTYTSMYKHWTGCIKDKCQYLPECPCCCLKLCLQLWSRLLFLCRCPAGQSSPDPDPLLSHPPLQIPTAGCPPASSADHKKTWLSSKTLRGNKFESY